MPLKRVFLFYTLVFPLLLHSTQVKSNTQVPSRDETLVLSGKDWQRCLHQKFKYKFNLTEKMVARTKLVRKRT